MAREGLEILFDFLFIHHIISDGHGEAHATVHPLDLAGIGDEGTAVDAIFRLHFREADGAKFALVTHKSVAELQAGVCASAV